MNQHQLKDNPTPVAFDVTIGCGCDSDVHVMRNLIAILLSSLVACSQSKSMLKVTKSEQSTKSQVLLKICTDLELI